MKKLLIVGAGGHGRCCLDIIRDLNCYDEISFLDDSCIDKIENCYPEYKDIFIAIGNNKLRKKLIHKAKNTGYHVISVIAPDAAVSSYATIKEGTVVFYNAVIEADAKIGTGCIITANTTVNHDAIIEDYCLIYSNSVIRPNALVGSMSRIGSNCTVAFNTKIKAGSDIEDGSVINPSDEYSFEVGV